MYEVRHWKKAFGEGTGKWELYGEPDIVGVVKGCRLRLSGQTQKKIAEKIPLLIYKSLTEGIRPIGDQDQGGKTWSIKKCDSGT